mmetsp:Transcript_11913/g.42120  ORF Transcript_11913/g.42120 Transcript_11913/m.42120 type:complete len:219 (+) Transcript_11913:83-739(+)
MPLRLRGNDAAHPFVTSDLWRGFLTSCHQTDVHVEREYRYYPVELTIDAVVGTKVTATFVTHADHSFYELKGEYEEATRRLYLTPVRGVVGRRWEPCDAEVYISHDGTTLSGNSICDQHGECDDGGGEFVLRHDRTQLVVEGAGLAGVNGIYTSQRNAADLSAVATPSQAEQDGRLYDGAPIYVQACSGECAQHAVIHVVNGQYGFWQIIEAFFDPCR